MKKVFTKLKSLLPTKRKLIQLYFALLFNANAKGFGEGTIFRGSTKSLCIPGLNCYSCPGAIGACPLGSLQGSFSAGKSTVFYVFGILMLFGLALGRTICGWLCPFGLIQELLFKIKTPKVKKSPVTRLLSYLKYVILAFFVFLVPILYAFKDTPLPAFCKYICPAGTLEGGISLLSNKLNESYFAMLGPLFTWKFLLLVSFVVGCVFVFRLFCRFFCPLGALYGFFNRISFVGVKVDAPKCTNCDLCVHKCKMDIKKVGDAECISCGECVDVCPTGAISWKGVPKKKSLPEDAAGGGQKQAKFITRCVSAVLMIALLAGVFVYAWNDTGDQPGDVSSEAGSEESSSSIPYGNQVGELCYQGELFAVDGNGVSETAIDVIEEGKITVINFWGTWCTPCVNELPYFDRIATEYEGSVSVVAIHTNMVANTASGYIAQHYPDSKIRFACDGAGEAYYTTLGGRGTYPYTVVVDENGVIAAVFVQALEYEELQEIVETLLAD
ncbi:MAG: 4Fe-4S binding protein [Clostridia bacterium]|nr:4Fe-4S binding protein [Clostridia bacterium]